MITYEKLSIKKTDIISYKEENLNIIKNLELKKLVFDHGNDNLQITIKGKEMIGKLNKKD